MQASDVIREEIQQNIRQAVRDAANATRDAQRAVQAEASARGQAQQAEAMSVLRAEIAGVRKEIADLTGQLTPGLSDARTEAIQSQLENANDRLENLQEALTGQITGRPTIIQPPFSPDVIPREAVTMSIWFFSTVSVTIVAVAIIRALTRRADRRATMQIQQATDVSPRLDRIEQALEAVAIEVERISEGQRYTNRVIGALPAGAAAWQGVQREPVPVHRKGEG